MIHKSHHISSAVFSDETTLGPNWRAFSRCPFGRGQLHRYSLNVNYRAVIQDFRIDLDRKVGGNRSYVPLG